MIVFFYMFNKQLNRFRLVRLSKTFIKFYNEFQRLKIKINYSNAKPLYFYSFKNVCILITIT